MAEFERNLQDEIASLVIIDWTIENEGKEGIIGITSRFRQLYRDVFKLGRWRGTKLVKED